MIVFLSFYQKNIEANFFRHFLKENGKGENKLPEAYVFDTGVKDWKTYDAWPPKNAVKETMFLNENKLTTQSGKSGGFYRIY